MLLNSAIFPCELVQANTVLEAQVPLPTRAACQETEQGWVSYTCHKQESFLDPLVVLYNGIKIQHCFPVCLLLSERSN